MATKKIELSIKSASGTGWNNIPNCHDKSYDTKANVLPNGKNNPLSVVFTNVDATTKGKIVSANLCLTSKAYASSNYIDVKNNNNLLKTMSLSEGVQDFLVNVTDLVRTSNGDIAIQLIPYASSAMYENTIDLYEVYIELEVTVEPGEIVEPYVAFSDEKLPTHLPSVVKTIKSYLGGIPICGYLNGKYVKRVTPVGTQGGLVLSNPSITVKDYKARLEQDGYVQYFDVTFVENTNAPGYVKSKSITDELGNTYYLALFNEGDSAFRVDGLYPGNGGWTNMTPELRTNSCLLYKGHVDLNVPFVNVNNSIPRALLEAGLKSINATLRGLNYHVVDRSRNTATMMDVNDGWYGALYRYSDHFVLNLNHRAMVGAFGGEFVAGDRSKNGWLSVFCHELGHSLGFPDGLTHSPTLYNYDNPDKSIYAQSNDIEYLVRNFKEKYQIDLRNLENTNKEVVQTFSNADEGVWEFSFPEYENPDNEADVILECTLNYKELREIPLYSDLTMSYKVYEICDPTIIKGSLDNMEVKIHEDINIHISPDKKYRLRLNKYDNDSNVLINPTQGVII